MPSSSISTLYCSPIVVTNSSAEAGAWAAKPLMMSSHTSVRCFLRWACCRYSLYSWVMTPFAFRMPSLASSTMWSGVSLGKLIMTDFWGAAAMVVAANSAVKMDRVAKRIAKSLVEFWREMCKRCLLSGELFGGGAMSRSCRCYRKVEAWGTIWGARERKMLRERTSWGAAALDWPAPITVSPFNQFPVLLGVPLFSYQSSQARTWVSESFL